MTKYSNDSYSNDSYSNHYVILLKTDVPHARTHPQVQVSNNGCVDVTQATCIDWELILLIVQLQHFL